VPILVFGKVSHFGRLKAVIHDWRQRVNCGHLHMGWRCSRPEEVVSSHRKEFAEWVGGAKKEPRQGGALRSSLSAGTAAEGGYSTLAQMNTVELCLPVIGLLLGPVLIYMDFPSMLN
jgi:hypothetical protein